MPQEQTQSAGISKILSGEPLPVIPPNDDPETMEYRRKTVNYLRRLAGLLTTQNIIGSDLRVVENNGFIPSASNGSYTLVEYCEFKSMLSRVTHIVSSGSCTINIAIDGTNVSGTGDNTVSTSQGVYTFPMTSVSIGQRISVVVSGASSPVNLAFTLKREWMP